jgi:hypothetical protein
MTAELFIFEPRPASSRWLYAAGRRAHAACEPLDPTMPRAWRWGWEDAAAPLVRAATEAEDAAL